MSHCISWNIWHLHKNNSFKKGACTHTHTHTQTQIYKHIIYHIYLVSYIIYIHTYIYTYNHIYIYTIIYIYMHKYIYIAHHCCPFVGRPLGLGTERERLQRRTVCRQRLQNTASTRPPYVFSVSARAADQMWNLQSFHWSQEYMSHLWAVRFAAPRGWTQRLIREETPI